MNVIIFTITTVGEELVAPSQNEKLRHRGVSDFPSVMQKLVAEGIRESSCPDSQS